MSKHGIDLNGHNVYVDSFDSTDPTKSTEGRYDAAKKQPYGNVAFGVTLTNSIAGAGHANIYGYVFMGPGPAVSIGSGGSVGPSFSSPATNVSDAVSNGWIRSDCFLYVPDVGLPTGAASWSSLGSINNNMTINAGDYKVSGISLSGAKKLTLQGSVRLYVTGDVSTAGDASIEISPGASLVLYAAGDVSIAGTGIVNNAGVARDNQLYGLPTSTSWQMSGTNQWIGFVWAPEASVTFDGTVEMSGAIIASGISVGSSTVMFHYDESLNVRVCSGAAIDDAISGIQFASNDILIRLPIAFFKSYAVEYRDDLTAGEWTTLATTNTSSCTGEVVNVMDPGGADRPQRFYRLRIHSQGFGF